MNTKGRIKMFLDFSNISGRRLSEKIEASGNYFNVTKTIGSDYLEKIHKAFPELNMDWVVTGRGEMLWEDHKEIIVHDNAFVALMMREKEKIKNIFYSKEGIDMQMAEQLAEYYIENLDAISLEALKREVVDKAKIISLLENKNIVEKELYKKSASKNTVVRNDKPELKGVEETG